MKTMTEQDQLATTGGSMTSCGIAFGILAVAACDPVLWIPMAMSSEMIGAGVAAACLL